MNKENLQPHIDALLATLDKQSRRSTEQQRPTTDEREAPYQQQPQTFIDVYVIERDAEEPPTVESTLEPAFQESQDDEEPATPTTPPHRGTRPRWWMIALVVLCTFLVGIGASISLATLYALGKHYHCDAITATHHNQYPTDCHEQGC